MPEVRPALLVDLSPAESGKAEARGRARFVSVMKTFLTHRLTLEGDLDEDEEDDDEFDDDDKDDNEESDGDDDDESDEDDEDEETWQVSAVTRLR